MEGGGGDEEALVCVYGAAVLSECFCIDAVKHGIRIRGYIGGHNFFKANKSYQNIFLNGRYIVNSTVSAAISNAYASYLMKRQYPFYTLHIDVPTEIVDVNVHPNKSDVRFADNQIIYGCIYSVISSILDGQTKAMEYVVKSPMQAPVVEDTTPVVTKAPEIIEDVPSQANVGFASLTYEQAKKEIEEQRKADQEELAQLRLEKKVNDRSKKLVEKGLPEFFKNDSRLLAAEDDKVDEVIDTIEKEYKSVLPKGATVSTNVGGGTPNQQEDKFAQYRKEGVQK
jgi:DNA mismatch repair ATPase MutL